MYWGPNSEHAVRSSRAQNGEQHGPASHIGAPSVQDVPETHVIAKRSQGSPSGTGKSLLEQTGPSLYATQFDPASGQLGSSTSHNVRQTLGDAYSSP